MTPSRVPRSPGIFALLTALTFLFGSFASWAQEALNAEAYFERGVSLFKAERYVEALDDFLAARQAGLDTPRLRFNIGVVNFRLRRYRDARAEFESVLDDPFHAARAKYNIGLTYRREGDRDRAAQFFAAAGRETENAQLRELSIQALTEI